MSHNAYLHLTFPTFYKCTHGCVQFKPTMYVYAKNIGTKLDAPDLMNKMLPPKYPPTYRIGCFREFFYKKYLKQISVLGTNK